MRYSFSINVNILNNKPKHQFELLENDRYFKISEVIINFLPFPLCFIYNTDIQIYNEIFI